MPDERVPLLDLDEANRRATEIHAMGGLADLSIFRILLRNPPVAKAVDGMLRALLFKGKLDPRLRELVIMRIAWRCRSEYEWTQHWTVARRLGVPEADILGVREWHSHDGYGPTERAVLAAVDDVIDSGRIGPETWEACRAVLGSDEVAIELVVAIGNWHMIAGVLASLSVPLEPGVQSWPPDGAEPAVG
ncbi:MAG: carboxymuconolactone decarboxylase family protein [Acidimicrobiales bacterium]